MRGLSLVAPFVAVMVSLLGACGGNSPSAKNAASTGTAPVDPAIGDIAVANGGLASLASPGSGAAPGPGSLHAELVDPDNRVKFDGVLGEWPARMRAGTVVKGSADQVSFAVAIQYDDRSLYVGGEVTGDSFFRTERFGDGEDHASLLLAFPSGRSFSAYEVGLFAGKPGETAGEVRFVGARRSRVPGAKIIEAPAAKGYTFEAQIPWSAFPEARTVRVGLRGAARYYASDGSSSARTIVATAEGESSSPASLPPLLTESEQSMVDGMLQAKGLSTTTPKVDLIADVAGDAMKERIEVFDRFFTICGPGYRRGKEFFFRDLGADLVSLEVRDVTGRGKADLIVRRRFTDGGGTREWFEVWSILGASDEPTTTFAHEVKVARDGKHVDDDVHLNPRARAIEVGYEAASGWDASSYREPVATDVEPILLPWGVVRNEVFRWDGTRFKKAKTVAQAGVAPPPSQERAREALPEQPSTPPESAGGDLSHKLFDQYRRDRGVSADVRPKFDAQVSVDGDPRPERVVLVGRDIVVFGPGFKGGREYAVLTLQQFADPADIHELSARDLTGDGGADLIVRGARHGALPGSPDSVDVDALFIYRVKDGTIARVFGIETAREQAGRRVQGLVQFVPAPGGHGFLVDVRPGRATRWSKQTYPWAQDTPGAGPVEPLLLPWGGIASLRYAWDGSQFSREDR